MPSSLRGSRWCFTLNNYTDQEVEIVNGVLSQPEVRYAIYGKEVGGDEGTPHLQGFVAFKKDWSLTKLRNILSSRAHFERARATEQEQYAYCSKEGDFVEFGKRSTQGKRSDLQEAIQAVKDGKSIREIAENHSSAYVKYGRGLKDLRLTLQKGYDHEDVRGIWLHGPPGSGKSHSAREIAGSHLFLKSQNKWWDGYNGEHVVLLDDLDTHTLGHYLKIWSDKYACTGETKGGTLHLHHRLFIVTSNYTPEELFKDDDVMAEAIRRRFNVIEKRDRDQFIDLPVYTISD